MPEWSADFTVDEAFARERIEGFVVPRSLRLLAEGWDNAVWLADERWVFRFPRRAVALPLIRKEIAVLGELSLPHALHSTEVAAPPDWGDVCRGDPSVDLPLYWCALSPAGREAFLDAYGPVSEEQLLRARVIAVFLCAVLAHYGAAEGLAMVEREALDGLKRAS